MQGSHDAALSCTEVDFGAAYHPGTFIFLQHFQICLTCRTVADLQYLADSMSLLLLGTVAQKFSVVDGADSKDFVAIFDERYFES